MRAIDASGGAPSTCAVRDRILSVDLDSCHAQLQGYSILLNRGRIFSCYSFRIERGILCRDLEMSERLVNLRLTEMVDWLTSDLS